MTKSVAYQRGVRAQQSNRAEPDCPYEPGTTEYADFADGFCAGIPDLDEVLKQQTAA